MNRHLAALLILAGGASFGLLASVVNIGFALGHRVPEITGSQQLFGAIITWLIALLNRRHWQKISIKTGLALMAVGSLSGLTGFFYYSSMARSSVSVGIVLLFQFTWIGTLYEWLFERRRPHPVTCLLLGMLLLGTVLAANLFAASQQPLSLSGVIYGLLAAFTFAGYLYASGKVATEISPWLRSPLMVTGSCLLILLLFPPVYLTPENLGAGLGWLGLVTALLGAVIPQICFAAGTPYLKAGVVTILSSVELPVAVLAAWLFLKEPVRPQQWLGVVLILAAIMLSESQWFQKKKGLISPGRPIRRNRK